MSTDQDDPRIGTMLAGRYEIQSPIAKGGMGVVYRGVHKQLGRTVAIKFLHEFFANDTHFNARFEREAKAMSKLAHPNCVSVIDYGIADAPYIVMDYVTGTTLRQTLDGGRLPILQAMSIARQLLAAVAHAHGHNIIHRDIKPANIMLTQATGVGDHLTIFDFGLAKLLDSGREGDLSTATQVVGTPNYMSPEQSRAEKVDARTDIYSVGAVLFEVFTGRKLFPGKSSVEVVWAHRETPPPRLQDAVPDGVFSEALEAAVAKALAKTPAKRFQTAQDFADALAAAPEAKAQAADKPLVEADDPRATRRDFPRTVADVSGNPTRFQPKTEKRRWQRLTMSLGAVAAIATLTAIVLAVALTRDTPMAPSPAVAADTAASATTTSVENPAPATATAPESAPATATVPATIEAPDAGAEVAVLPTATQPPTAPEHTDVELASTESSSDVVALALDQPQTLVKATLAEAKKLIAAGRRDDAIKVLSVLRRENTRNPYLPYLLGNLYFEKQWLADAIGRYREAMRLDGNYRKNQTINRNLISMLASDKALKDARAAIVGEAGRAALPFLREAAAKDPNMRVRTRARQLIKILKS